MANIVTQLQKILTAVYGEDVRGAIYDSLVAINAESSKASASASSAESSAQASAREAAESADQAKKVAGNVEGIADADLSGMNDRLSKAEESTSQLTTRVGTLESTVEKFDVKFEQTVEDKVNSSVKNATTEFETQIEGITQRVEQTEEDAQGTKARVSELETNIEGVEARVESIVSDSVSGAVEQVKAGLKVETDGIKQDVASLTETTEELAERTSSLETGVDGIEARVERTITDRITGAVNSAKAEWQVKADEISQNVANNAGQITEVSQKVDSIEADVEKTVTDKVTGAVNEAKTELKLESDKIAAEVASVKSDTQSLESRTTKLETTVNGLDLDVDKTVEDKVNSAVQTATEHFEATLDGLSNRVTQSEEDAQGLETRVGALESTVEGFDAQVEQKITDKVTGAVSEAKTELEGRIDGIEASVAQTVTDSLSGTVEQAKAELSEEVKGLDASIDAKIESSVENQVTGAVESATAGIQERIDGMEASITANVQQTVTDSVNETIESATSELEMQAGEITQRVESLEETSEGLTSKTAQIETKVDGIKLEVTQSAGTDGKVTAKITLTVGPNSYSGFIKMDGNLQVSGQLSADALYSALGDIADLTADKLSTSRKIVLHLANDTSDDNYVRIHEQYIEFVTDSTDGTEEQAVNPSGLPIYWEDDPEGADIGLDGYPYRDGQRIFITTKTTSWPVMVYKYKSIVKRSIGFEMIDGYYTPVDVFGAGDQSGNNRTRLYKKESGLELLHTASNGKKAGLTADNEGHLDLYGLRKTEALDFSGWDAGSFTETADGNTTCRYSVSFDDQQRPVRITDEAGHATTITW